MTRSLILLLAIAAHLTAEEPVRQASQARLWLKVPASQAPLRDVRGTTGNVSTASWEKDPAVRERHTDITFPIRWWSWSETTVTFTPAQDGSVELQLSGPWAEEKQGDTATLVRQEILWDDLSTEGTELLNGGFELTAEDRPAS